MTRTTIALAILLGWPAIAGVAQSRDPVTLVFEASGEQLALELGMIDQVRITPDAGAGPRLHVQLSTAASRLLAQFTERFAGQRMDVYACREKVLSAKVNARVSSGLIVIPVKDAASAEKMSDMLWHGTGCDRYLEH